MSFSAYYGPELVQIAGHRDFEYASSYRRGMFRIRHLQSLNLRSHQTAPTAFVWAQASWDNAWGNVPDDDLWRSYRTGGRFRLVAQDDRWCSIWNDLNGEKR